VQTALNLESSAVVIGVSSKMTPAEQAFELGKAWEASPEPKRQFLVQIVHPDGKVDTFHIGPHTPSMKTEDVHLVHRLWLNITREPGLDNVHHHDIVTQALTRFAHDYTGRERQEILRELRKSANKTVLTRPLDGNRLRQPVAPPAAGTDHPDSKKPDEGPPSPPLVNP